MITKYFILSLVLFKLTSLSYSAEAQILCKKSGKIYNALATENKKECFDSLYWGAVCYTGDAKEAYSLLKASLPLKSQSRRIDSVKMDKNQISYLGTDQLQDITEPLVISFCQEAFFR